MDGIGSDVMMMAEVVSSFWNCLLLVLQELLGRLQKKENKVTRQYIIHVTFSTARRGYGPSTGGDEITTKR